MSKKGPELPKAVICLAVFNGQAFLAELLDSLVAQSEQIDIVIRDDLSSDRSLEIIEDYAAKYSFIRILENRQRSGSARANFSKLLEEVVASERYQYYFFADQDDVWRSDKVALLLNKMVQLEMELPGTAILLHSDLEVVDCELEPIAKSFFSHQGLKPLKAGLNTVLVENPATGCAMAFNHQLAIVVLPLSDKAIMHDWWCSLVAFAIGAHVETVNECLVKYRQHSKNTLGAKKIGFEQFFQFVFQIRGLDLDRYYLQVQALIASENIELDDAVRVFLKDFLNTRTIGSIARIRFFLKYRVFKTNILKNIALLLLASRRKAAVSQ